MAANSFHFAMLSHPGRVRKGNEDVCDVSLPAGAFVVCDGMGGAAAGEVASRVAATTFLQALQPSHDDEEESPRTATPDIRLEAAIRAANAAVFLRSVHMPELRGMGTTLVALLLQPPAAVQAAAFPRSATERPSLTLAHVGDSRAYLFRGGELTQLTLDHSLVEEQLRMGEITPREAERHPMRNIITRAVGSQQTVEPDIRHLDPQPGDLFLLASDGLNRELPDAEIASTLRRALSRSAGRRPDLRSLCQTLINQANDAGGGDNITVLLLHLP